MCERGVRRDGDTYVEGLPRSTLRDLSRKLTFVPAGHEYHEWQVPRVLTRLTLFVADFAYGSISGEFGYTGRSALQTGDAPGPAEGFQVGHALLFRPESLLDV